MGTTGVHTRPNETNTATQQTITYSFLTTSNGVVFLWKKLSVFGYRGVKHRSYE